MYMHLPLVLVAACRAVTLPVVLLQDHPFVLNDIAVKRYVEEAVVIIADADIGIPYSLRSSISRARIPDRMLIALGGKTTVNRSTACVELFDANVDRWNIFSQANRT